MSAAYAPTLRPDVALTEKSDGSGASLWDPVLNREIGLGDVSKAIATALDGRPLETVFAKLVADKPELTPFKLEQTFRTLLLMNVVEGSGQSILERARAVQRGDVDNPIRTLPEARFACQSSGECCQNYTFGPLSEGDVARLDAVDIAGAFPELTRPYLKGIEHNGRTQIYLETEDDACVFLQPDQRCGIHAKFGAEVKPGFCQIYPIQALPTIDGVKYYDHGECASFAISAASGPPLSEQVERLIELVPEKYSLFHPAVGLEPGVQCDYGYVLALQDALVELVGMREGSAGDAVRAIGRMARRFVGGLGGCPLEAGQPELTVEAALGGDRARYYPEPDEAPLASQLERTSVVTADLYRCVIPRIAQAKPSVRQLLSERLYRQFAEITHATSAIAMHRAKPDQVPLSDAHKRVLAVELGPDVEAAMRRSLRYQLFGHRMMIDERLVPGLIRVGAVYLVAIMGGKLAADAGGRTRMSIHDFDTGHMIAQRVLRLAQPMGVLVAYESDAWDVLEAAPTVVAPI